MKQQLRLHPTTSPKRLRGLFGAASLLALTLSSGHALGQADISPPPPNVLLLVDTSGSMDYKTNSNSFPACHYAGSVTTGTATSERSRWIELVEVLTGSINNYDCQRLDRNSSLFKSEYSLGAVNPYDFLYANPYHRPSSNGCVAGPGTLDPTNPALFPAGAIKYHPFDNTLTTCSNFSQASDGILDAFLPDVRFGLMTFDTEPRPAKDMSGLWSYFLSAGKQGEPLGCITPQDQEVGVRNTDAPPWEGRAVGFGNPALGSTDYKSRNAMIQQVLLATRPYGATPIAGMLDDARTYFLSDNNADPLDGSFKFGPQSDPAKDCRHKSIVLLSDGQPNMDLRPFCEPAGCPYDKAEDIAQDLKSKGIELYVIGFALSSVTVAGSPRACSSFLATDFDESNGMGICKQNPNDQAIQACCALNRIAAAGGHAPTSPDDPDWRRARFADNRDELRSALSQAIGSNFKSTTRTPFVSASGSGYLSQSSDLTFARSFRFSASFQPGKLDKPWIGELDRARYKCLPDVNGVLKPNLLQPDATQGDKFVDNVNADGPDKRQIFSVIGNAPVASDASMRPNLALGVVDGVGTYAGNMSAAPRSSAQFVTDTTPEAIRVNDTTCDSSTADLNAVQCRDRYLKWLVGLDNGTIFNRCPSVASGNCNLISEIYHSVPRAVAGRPSQFLVDSSYQKFVTDELAAKRPSVLYASSNDGFLHAFKILQVDKNDSSETMQVKTKETNELWTFVPPAVLPGIPALYPASHQLLLDGTPAIKEVVATADNTLTSYKFRLERTRDQARGGAGEWRTILVQSFGAARPGYFALDITDPVPTGTGGPKFLWQLMTDSAGNQLFGSGGGTPLITTVFLGGKEIAVAVLPGGYGSAGTGGPAPGNGCSRAKTDWATTMAPETLTPRRANRIPCYTDSAIRARSLTVVRLDSGEILRTFRQAEAEVPGLVGKNVYTQALIDSPMTGQPVAYPADVGAVADRVFIGDQDGTLWRLNLASDTGITSDWKVDLFVDGFPEELLSGSSPIPIWHQGQPIISTPIVSVNQIGNLTVAFSTGEQEAIGAAPGLANYVWSITEVPSADRTQLFAKTNWHLNLTGSLSGDRVIGEMALFNGDLFFSTVGPDAANDACSSGSGKVWGMHYTDPNPGGTGKGGRTSTTLTTLVGTGGYIDATTLLGSDAHAFLSGVSVAQQPTCDTTGSGTDDGFFAYGSQPSAGAVTPGKYQLIIPTGDKVSTSTKPGITPINSGGGNGVAIDLQQPPVSLIVDSWASIVE
jgi:type IV pilus assembly protein PilY1